MRRLFFMAAICCAALLAAQTGGSGTARARAGLHADSSEGHLEVSSIVFDLTLGSNPSGELSFAAEGHDHGDGDGMAGPSVESVRYPHIVVTLETVESATIQGNKLTVKGTGVFNNDPVIIEATAQDSGPNGKGDKFSLVCQAPGGAELFFASGKVTSGDISIQGGGR
jgi:hypothetical protein